MHCRFWNKSSTEPLAVVPSSASDDDSGTDFRPLTTGDRWWQESAFLYGNAAASKANKLTNSLLNALMPVAAEEHKKKKEKEDQAAKEREEKKKQDEEARLSAQAEKAGASGSGSVTSATPGSVEATNESTPMDVEEGTASTTPEAGRAASLVEATPETQPSSLTTPSASTPVPASAPGPAASSTTVTVHGTTIDLADTGIDPTFLEALPEDLRAEVIAQHFRDQRRQAGATAASGLQLSPEFLNALPADIRGEVLLQERQLQMHRQHTSTSGTDDATEMDPATFLASLDPQLRQTVLLEQDDAFLSRLPTGIAAEAGNLRSRVERRFGQPARRNLPALAASTSIEKSQPSSSKPSLTKEPVQLVDRQGISSIVRLLFVQQTINKAHLYSLLLNVSENSKSRADLMSLLIAILQEGSDGGDKNGKAKTRSTPRKAAAVLNTLQQTASETSPNVMIQRSLDALLDLAGRNEQVASFFLADSEALIPKTPSKAKKGKSKSKVPIVMLLGLLERPIFLNSPPLMDSLSQLLSVVVKPLSALAEKESKAD
jgi:E3 ubiquitin-protein ligase HUWE1